MAKYAAMSFVSVDFAGVDFAGEDCADYMNLVTISSETLVNVAADQDPILGPSFAVL